MSDSAEHPAERPAEQGAPRSARRHVWDNPKNVQILIWSFWAACAVVFALDFLFHRHPAFTHGELPLEGFIGFYSIYGFVACVLLVLVAKQMRKVLMRGEDYYEPKSHHEPFSRAGSNHGE